MKNSVAILFFLLFGFGTALPHDAASNNARIPQEQVPPEVSALSCDLRKRHGIPRQSQASSTPDSSSWYTLHTIEAGDRNCLSAQLGVDGSVPYPVRFESCNQPKDSALWQFVPDSDGAYFVYNKGWRGTKQRLDIHCQEPELCIMWMGPSDDKYNNQRWYLVGLLVL